MVQPLKSNIYSQDAFKVVTLLDLSGTSGSGPPQRIVVGYTQTKVQFVALHEVEGALVANFICQFLLAFGMGGVFSSLDIVVGSLIVPVWVAGLVLVVVAGVVYLMCVVRKWNSWKKGVVFGPAPSFTFASAPTHSFGSDSGTPSTPLTESESQN